LTKDVPMSPQQRIRLNGLVLRRLGPGPGPRLRIHPGPWALVRLWLATMIAVAAGGALLGYLLQNFRS
jgi:hypothetical protein